MKNINSAFVIRPFNVKSNVDFEIIHEVLIAPALENFGITRTTTLDILEAGNIRADMFRLLLTADVVVADLSVHNANVFYELGIRHALVKKHTIMIRSEVDQFPFDLFTDRYFPYEHTNPQASLPKLIEAIEQTLNTANETDSPVFDLLPGLAEPDAESFIAVPPGFSEKVREVRAAKTSEVTKTTDLALLATEIAGLRWEIAGLRHIGRALFKMKAFNAARQAWERIRESDPGDIEANHLLSTIYQRLGQLPQAEIAVDRVLQHRGASKSARSEALALRARNAKREWVEDWNSRPTVADKRKRALTSPLLRKACLAYYDAYLLDLRNFYPGVNALACAVLLSELAKAQPAIARALDVTMEPFETMLAWLPGSVRVSIQAALEDASEDDRVWAEVSLADLDFCAGMDADVLALRYESRTANIEPFNIGAVRDQLAIFRDLEVFAPAALAVLEVIKQAKEAPRAEPPYVILFTGHRVDVPGRDVPRFPLTKVGAAEQEIDRTIESILAKHENVIGVAGAASGGDILFHEAMRRRGLTTEIYLALPPDPYARESVEPSQGDWHDRFHALLRATPPRVLQESKTLPDWLLDKKSSYTVWERSNLWMLSRALVNGGGNMALFALWNGESGDGPGGTKDMVDRARERGANVKVLGQGTIF
ncbi:MAG TPA: tetratricopeptide repeat-containing protein [Thermoanaerobaculia bacterium]|nr:tetratricopeptide repeat-containing protein [Thermoanaerobaculia bacterium]